MRNKDQVLLENAYEQVLNEFMGKTLGTAALAAGMAFGGMDDVRAGEKPYNDMGRIGYSQEFSPDGALEEAISLLSNVEEIGNFTEFPPIDEQLLKTAAISKNLKNLEGLTDSIQLKGYKVPPYFKNYRVLKPKGP